MGVPGGGVGGNGGANSGSWGSTPQPLMYASVPGQYPSQ